MKATVMVIALSLLVFSATVQAQEYRNDISFSLGVATFPDMAETTKDIGGIFIIGGLFRQESKSVTPAIVFNYGRFIKEDLRLGFTFGYQKFEVEHFVADYSSFTSEISYYNFMVRGDYTYFRREWVQLYSGAGLGLAVVMEEDVDEKETETEYWFAFHVNALGVRVGKRVAGFAELGFGFNGILAAGVTAVF